MDLVLISDFTIRQVNFDGITFLSHMQDLTMITLKMFDTVLVMELM